MAKVRTPPASSFCEVSHTTPLLSDIAVNFLFSPFTSPVDLSLVLSHSDPNLQRNTEQRGGDKLAFVPDDYICPTKLGLGEVLLFGV